MIRGFVAEGRTVLLSSHLLDEVEKICDAVAIVDRGRVVMQGSIDELAAGGEQRFSSPRATTNGRAQSSAHRAVASAPPRPTGSACVSTDVEAEAAADDIGRRLVLAGLAIRRFEPARASLEQRFLEITSRLEEAA